LDPDFKNLVRKLPENAKRDFHDLQTWPDAHYITQSSYCGGLSEQIENYDFVGHFSHNYTQVSDQVVEMLTLASRRSSSQMLQANVEDEEEEAGIASLVHHIFAPDVPENVPKPLSLSETAIVAARGFFPPEGPSVRSSHNRFVTEMQLTKLYEDKGVLREALDFLSDDYAKLPGLSVPNWTHQQ
jgi:hypothetical protein